MKKKMFDLIEKYLKKDIYLQKKDGKLLIIKDEDNITIAEYQKMISLLDKTPNQPSKSRIKTWVEINDDLRGTYSAAGQIKFKT